MYIRSSFLTKTAIVYFLMILFVAFKVCDHVGDRPVLRDAVSEEDDRGAERSHEGGQWDGRCASPLCWLWRKGLRFTIVIVIVIDIAQNIQNKRHQK